jgi:hypothetical protein
MFSVENFYYILYTNLLKPANISIGYFKPFGSTKNEDFLHNFELEETGKIHLKADIKYNHRVVCYDQEPLLLGNFNKLSRVYNLLLSSKCCNILANSEHSPLRTELCRNDGFISWYYFFHGFAALDWYRDYQYLSIVEHQFTKVFISLNRIVTNDRSYRLLLVSNLIKSNLIDSGIVSLNLNDTGYGTWKEEISDPKTKLPKDQLNFIEATISSLPGSLIADVENPLGNFSAHSGPSELSLNQRALWHIVSETVFYYDKLHLTEKIFKPIVSRRPFILVAAPGNLAYLKSYGFKTFDKWIDENYDNEKDPTLRIELITKELEKLCKLSAQELNKMHQEMKEILDFNFNHFYGDFKNIIVDELVDNFEGVVARWNCNRLDNKHINISSLDFNQIKELFKK